MKTSRQFYVLAGKFISHLSLDFLGKCIGEEAKYEGVRLLFDGLQQPVLNKQVHKDAPTHTNSMLVFHSWKMYLVREKI